MKLLKKLPNVCVCNTFIEGAGTLDTEDVNQ